MFKSAALKLTVSYLLIIMALSIGLSFALYRVASTEVERIAQGQFNFLSSLLGPIDVNNFLHVRSLSLDEDRLKLRNNLLIFNGGVLVFGGLASYFLARRTLRPIETALKAQSRFAADASHELRTPLTAMQAENEVALRNSKLTQAEAITLLKSNLEEVGKLKDLSESLLALASAGQKTGGESMVSVRKALSEATERVKKPSAAKKIQLKSSGPKLFVKANFAQMVQLLTILLENAVKYSPDRGKVTVKVSKHGNWLHIEVTDQGKGIKPQDLPKIFDRFYRAESSRRKEGEGGYGLGLAIAKRITELHGGTISAKSEANKGSTFIVRLPRI